MAGFEIVDTITWVNGQGMSQGLNIGKAMEAAAGVKVDSSESWRPVTEDGKRWLGYSTRIKGAVEFVVVGRKPFVTSVVENLKANGTGAMHIDAGRIPAVGKPPGWLKTGTVGSNATRGFGGSKHAFVMAERTPEAVAHVGEAHEQMGRYPVNLVFTHAEGCVCVGAKRVRGIKGTAGGRAVGKNSNATKLYGAYTGGSATPGAPLGFVEKDGTEGVSDWICAPDCPVRATGGIWGVSKSGRMQAGQQRKASSGKGFNGTNTFRKSGVATLKESPASEGSPTRFFTLPDPWAQTLLHLSECVVTGHTPKRKGTREGPLGRRPSGSLCTVFGDKGDPMQNAQGYDEGGLPIYACVKGCPIEQARTDAVAADVGFYSTKVHPPARMLPGYLTIKPKVKPEQVGVDEVKAEELCKRWGIPQGRGESWLETLLGWPIPEAAVPQTERELFQPAMHLHPTTKTLTVMGWLVRLYSPRPETVDRPVVVMDPFGGSGTTCLAAAAEGRTPVYNDFTPRYTAVAAARLAIAGVDALPVSRLQTPEDREWGGSAMVEESESVGGAAPAANGDTKLCPKCATVGSIAGLFGYRKMQTPKGEVVRAQSWSRTTWTPRRTGRTSSSLGTLGSA